MFFMWFGHNRDFDDFKLWCSVHDNRPLDVATVKAISSEITSKSKIRVTVFENGYDDSNPEGSKL